MIYTFHFLPCEITLHIAHVLNNLIQRASENSPPIATVFPLKSN